MNPPPLRAVFDPELPASILRRLRKRPHFLLPDTDRAFPFWVVIIGVSVVWTVLCVPLVLAFPPISVFLALLTLVLLCAGTLLFSVVYAFDDDGKVVSFLPFPFMPVAVVAGVPLFLWGAGELLIFLLLAVMGLLFGGFAWEHTSTPDWVVHGILAGGAGIVLVVVAGTRPLRLARTYRDRYLLPVDLGVDRKQDVQPPEAALLERVQVAIDQVREGMAVLGAATDARSVLPLLLSEEWRLAVDLREQFRLRLQHEDRRAQAADTSVLRALAQQEQHLRRALGGLNRRAGRITAYGDSVQAALRAYQAWQQCQEIVEADSSYSDFAARAAAEDHLDQTLSADLQQAEAARKVFDEHVRRLLGEGRGLSLWLGEGQ